MNGMSKKIEFASMGRVNQAKKENPVSKIEP